jgi:hypothetical protein
MPIGTWNPVKPWASWCCAAHEMGTDQNATYLKPNLYK